MQNPLDSIVYITIPENFTVPANAFQIDVTIPLPVQKAAGMENQFDSSTLSWEMILAGMLTIMAYEKENIHLPYYRSLLKAVRPDIKKELTEAAILKARNEDYDIAEEIFAALRGFDPDDVGTLVNSALFYDERGSSYRKSGLFEDADACDVIGQHIGSELDALEARANGARQRLCQLGLAHARHVLQKHVAIAHQGD